MVQTFLLLVITAYTFAGCTTSKNPDEFSTKEAPFKQTNRPLERKLEEKKQNFLEKASEEKIEQYERGIADVRATGILESACNIGDKAPLFTLPDVNGEMVSLADLLKDGPVVLNWYRGGWCPYCRLELQTLQEYLPKFKKAGATLVAISPQVVDSSLATRDKTTLKYPVLSDVGNKIARKYGIVFTLPDFIAESYNNGFGLAKYNDDHSNELPLAATYVIDRKGIIRYAFLDADYRVRAEPCDVLMAVQHLNREKSSQKK
ncbi:AhpC/TSA family protein [bacterium]|nr:AhpC/TSA family protein [bacterium]